MKRVFLMLMCALFVVAGAQATDSFSELSKDITHVFGDIKRGDRLEIANKFGNVVFRIHKKNEIKALINVKVAAASKQAATNMLNKVNVKTDVKNSWNYSSYSIKNNYYGDSNEETKVEINCVVYIPKDLLAIKVKNEFGNVYIEEYGLPFEANVRFGDLIAGRLMHNEQMFVSVEYGKLQIDEAVTINAGVRFGEAKIGRADYLNLCLQHSEGSVGDVNNLAADLKHVSDLNIMGVEKVKINALSFTTLNIESLKSRLDVVAAGGTHSNVKIAVQSAKKFEGIRMNCSFTPVELLLPKDIVAQCNLSSSNGMVTIKNLPGDNLKDGAFRGKRYSGNLGAKRKGVDYTKLPKIDIVDSFANIEVDVVD